MPGTFKGPTFQVRHSSLISWESPRPQTSDSNLPVYPKQMVDFQKTDLSRKTSLAVRKLIVSILHSFNTSRPLRNSNFVLKNPKFRFPDKLFSRSFIVHLYRFTWISNEYPTSNMDKLNSLYFLQKLFILPIVFPNSVNGNFILLTIHAPNHRVFIFLPLSNNTYTSSSNLFSQL